VDQMDSDFLRLQESIDPVNSLNEIVELEPDAKEDCIRAVVLEIRAGPEHRGFGRQILNPAFREINNRILEFLQFFLVRPLCSVDRDHARYRLLNRPPLVFKIVPEKKVLVWFRVDDLAEFF